VGTVTEEVFEIADGQDLDRVLKHLTAAVLLREETRAARPGPDGFLARGEAEQRVLAWRQVMLWLTGTGREVFSMDECEGMLGSRHVRRLGALLSPGTWVRVARLVLGA